MNRADFVTGSPPAGQARSAARKAPTAEIVDAVKRHAHALYPRIKEIRRYLHRRPELPGDEHRTAAFLAEIASDLGLSVRQPEQGGNGLCVEMIAGRSVLLVAEMGADPIATSLTTSYASRHDGLMHARGHDAVMAAVWGALAILVRLTAEGMLGRAAIGGYFWSSFERHFSHQISERLNRAIEPTSAAISMDLCPYWPAGTIGSREGTAAAGRARFACVFRVDLDEAAERDSGDTVRASTAWLNEIHHRFPQHHDIRDPSIVDIESVSGGNGDGAIGELTVVGSVRGFSQTALDRTQAWLKQTGEAISILHGVQVRLSFRSHLPPLVNDSRLSEMIRTRGARIVGKSRIRSIDQPEVRSNEFAALAKEIPGAVMQMGVARLETAIAPLGSPSFDIDELAMESGAAALALTAIAASDNSDNEV